MSYVIDEDFTHNEMIIEGKDAVNFFRDFQGFSVFPQGRFSYWGSKNFGRFPIPVFFQGFSGFPARFRKS